MIYRFFKIIMLIVFAGAFLFCANLFAASSEEESEEVSRDPQTVYEKRFGSGSWDKLSIDERQEFISKMKGNRERFHQKGVAFKTNPSGISYMGGATYSEVKRYESQHGAGSWEELSDQEKAEFLSVSRKKMEESRKKEKKRALRAYKKKQKDLKKRAKGREKVRKKEKKAERKKMKELKRMISKKPRIKK